MANEGIMSMPGGMGMQGEEAQQRPAVTSADSYDAAQTALGMVNPGEQAALKEALRQNIGDLQLTPEQLDLLIQVFEYVSQHPGDYKNLVQKMIEGGALDEGDMPEEYDPEFIGAMLAVLQEMRQMQGAGAQEPMDMSPIVEGLQPVGMASGGLADVASYLAAKGRGGDSILAHITPEEAAMLKRHGGSGTINPATGLPEFKGGPLGGIVDAVKGVVKGVVNVVKDVLKSPVGRILGTIALATVLGPAGLGLTMSTATAAGLAGAGTTLLSGGSLKDALISGALGYVGGGGTIMGASPVASLGQYLPGAAGGALNTGLATGLIGAGIGKLGGMSTADALKMGLTSGVTAGALKGLSPGEGGQAGSAEGTPADATGRFASSGDATAPGPISATGAVGTTGTAQDLLTGQGLNPNRFSGETGLTGRFDGANAFRTSYSPADFSTAAGGTGTATNYGLAPAGSSGEPGLGVRLPGSLGAADLSSAAGGTSGTTNYSLLPRGAATPASSPGFIDKMVTGAKDLYSEYLSPSRPGVGPGAGMFTKYGPLAATGVAATAALGGFEAEQPNQNPLYNRNYTGSDYLRDNPDQFAGGLDRYTPPSGPRSPIVETPSYATIPIGSPGMIRPGGITSSPAGIAQPYNIAGLYGVPLIYGPDGRPQRLAKGGIPKPTNFPRQNGPISGPGTGTSDDIPAMLSDGEFVFTAKAVRNAGGGSRRKGAARMYKLMKKLEGGPV